MNKGPKLSYLLRSAHTWGMNEVGTANSAAANGQAPYWPRMSRVTYQMVTILSE